MAHEREARLFENNSRARAIEAEKARENDYQLQIERLNVRVDETLAALEKEKATLTEKAEAVLSKVDLTLSDLTPKYSCPECKDTGYVGSHRCNCFDRKPNEKK